MKYLNEISQEIQNEKLQNKPEESQNIIEKTYNEPTLEIKNETPEDPKPEPKFTKRKILFYIILTILITVALKIVPGLI